MTVELTKKEIEIKKTISMDKTGGFKAPRIVCEQAPKVSKGFIGCGLF